MRAYVSIWLLFNTIPYLPSLRSECMNVCVCDVQTIGAIYSYFMFFVLSYHLSRNENQNRYDYTENDPKEMQ